MRTNGISKWQADSQPEPIFLFGLLTFRNKKGIPHRVQVKDNFKLTYLKLELFCTYVWCEDCRLKAPKK